MKPHSGSIAWNAFRKRWVTVFMQAFGKPSVVRRTLVCRSRRADRAVGQGREGPQPRQLHVLQSAPASRVHAGRLAHPDLRRHLHDAVRRQPASDAALRLQPDPLPAGSRRPGPGDGPKALAHRESRSGGFVVTATAVAVGGPCSIQQRGTAAIGGPSSYGSNGGWWRTLFLQPIKHRSPRRRRDPERRRSSRAVRPGLQVGGFLQDDSSLCPGKLELAAGRL